MILLLLRSTVYVKRLLFLILLLCLSALLYSLLSYDQLPINDCAIQSGSLSLLCLYFACRGVFIETLLGNRSVALSERRFSLLEPSPNGTVLSMCFHSAAATHSASPAPPTSSCRHQYHPYFTNWLIFYMRNIQVLISLPMKGERRKGK